MSKDKYVTVKKNIRYVEGKGYSYRYNYNDANGKRVNKEGKWFNTVEEAELARVKFDKEIKGVLEKAKIVEYTFEDIFNIYMKVKSPTYSYNTINSYNTSYNVHFKKLLGNQNINNIKMSDITDYYFSLYKTHSFGFIQTLHKKLKAIFNFAETRELLEKNKIALVELPPNKSKDEGKVKIYTDEQIELMDERFKRCKGGIYTAFLLMKDLGIRKSEVFGLTWDDVDFKKKTISINKQMLNVKIDGKDGGVWILGDLKCSSSHRVIDLQDSLNQYLKDLKKQQDEDIEYSKSKGNFVKTSIDLYDEYEVKIDTIKNPEFIMRKKNTRGKFDNDHYKSSSTNIIERIAKRELGITDFKAHKFRHTHCSRLVEKGVNRESLRLRMGHSSIDTANKYYIHETQNMRDELKMAINNI